MDNAPYHTRQGKKVPIRSSTKAQIAAYLEEEGVTVLADAAKADLLYKLDAHAGARSGMSALRRYVTERDQAATLPLLLNPIGLVGVNLRLI
ncbi:unnamed protein product [Cylicocyclus nassatus]|uniref:Uncharacterized protein n=1 Tax=Cylicocyclus nassatus TaxID=53992 RepID=A0AA36DLY9_CYLNA|nr:unnamed protein product [Cylicocyclus nassatus]